MESFLGVNMQRENGHLYLSQPGLIAKMVKKADLPEAILYYGNPMREDFRDEYQDDAPAFSQEMFRSLLGMLIYHPNLVVLRLSHPVKEFWEYGGYPVF